MSATQSEAALFRTYVVPFVLFLGFNLLLWLADSSWKWDHPTVAWYQRAPELWIYPLQVVVCGAYLVAVRREAEWAADLRRCLLGAAFGAVGIGLWLIPYFTGWIPAEDGFCPERYLGAGSTATVAAYACRFARAALIVPFVEEFFWRGYLMRWCVNRDFPQNVPLGKATWLSYAVVTGAFMLVHRPCDYAGALVYGSLAFLLVVRTRGLVPVIIMHAVANLIMGICAVTCNLPHLW